MRLRSWIVTTLAIISEMTKTAKAPDSPKSAVLSDHRRCRNRYIPPFIDQLGSYESGCLVDPRWHERILPELAIHGLLNDLYGLRRGGKLSLALAQSAADALCCSSKVLFMGVSDFAKLSASEQAFVRHTLDGNNQLDDIKEAFYPLFRFYPEFPLSFLFCNGPIVLTDPAQTMQHLKHLLRRLGNRWGSEGTFMQASAVSIANNLGFLFAAEGLDLPDFNAVLDFPNTDESRRAGSAIRAIASTFWSQPDRANEVSWSTYFWSRGRKLEECSYD
jgi:hypothetical protein